MDKAKSVLEKKIVTASEYENYRRNNYYLESLRNNFECPECGDKVTFVRSGSYVAYFKHMPCHEGHNYCSLFSSGTVSNSNESILRKKLLDQANISLNFELQYNSGKWSSYITVPPFKKDEIEKHTQNNTRLIISDHAASSRKIEIEINNEKFSSGEIKKIRLNGFPKDSYIRINGKNCNHVISYTFECFNPNKQFYCYLISQNYDSNNQNFIDLKRISNITLKKHVGKIYTGRHYILIYSANSYQISKILTMSGANAKRILLNSDNNFGFQLVDVCFDKVTDETKKFCADHNCELVQKDDAVILWPPVVSEAEYKYFSIGEKMFIASETDSGVNNIKRLEIANKLFLRIDNINADPYYVTKSNKFINDNDVPLGDIEIMNNEFSLSEKNSFLFINDVLIKEIEENEKIRKKQSIIEYDNVLKKKIYEINNCVLGNEKLLDAIRYGKKYVPFSTREYELINDLYKKDEIVNEYLSLSLEHEMIKREALDILMGD